MANIENFIPFLIFWETGAKATALTNEQLFAKAKPNGFTNDPKDRGGATMIGITIAAYRDYCRRKNLPSPTSLSLTRITYSEWRDLLKTMFWDRWQADLIANQQIAEMLVDWVWTSGAYGITIPQRLLGVKADGIVGPKTLDAVNRQDPAELFQRLKQARTSYIDQICRRRPANLRFRQGWLRRINAI